MGDVPDSWKAATARLSVSGRTGTGYLVAPNRIATCHHLVEGAKEVSASLGEKTLKAIVLGADRERHVAVLAFEGSVDAKPLPLAEALQGKAEFLGFGFSSGAGHPGRAFDGVVLNPTARDDKGRRALQVYSEATTKGRIQTRQGFCGSPLWVDGSVVGHLTRELGESNDLDQSYGVIYAAPVDAVRRLLDVEPEVRAISPVAIAETSYDFESLGAGHYHVFVTYRSSDRQFALSLAKRLEGAGLRVFLDQNELEPEVPLAPSLQQAITNSRAAVVLVSEKWLASTWCQKKADVLKQRALEGAGFALIPLRLDERPLPAFLADLASLAFPGQKWAEGPSVERLLQALRPSDPSAIRTPSPVDVAVNRVLDAFLRQLRAAAKLGWWKPVRKVLGDWEQYGSQDKTPLLVAAELLVGINRPNQAVEVLKGAGAGPRALQLRALALVKSGQRERATQILQALYDDENRDSETGGILAGIYKQRWRLEGGRPLLLKAWQLYKETWEHTGDPYNGINASALALQLGEGRESQALATRVLGALKAKEASQLEHWDLATIGEAHLLSHDLKEASVWYSRAVAREPDLVQDTAAMRAQARMNLKALGEREDTLDDVFPTPTVMAFAGHLVDEPDRGRPRFPPGKEGEVRLAIRKRLEEIGRAYAYCSAARGSDIIFLEELIDRGGQARIMLPFPVEDYKRISVGPAWEERFDKVVAHSRTELVAPEEPAPQRLEDLQKAFVKTSKAIYSEASMFAKGLDQKPILLAVWDGKAGDGPGGTADAIKVWEAQGHEVRVIDVHEPLRVPKPQGGGPRARLHIGRKQARLALAGGVVAVLLVLALASWTDVILDTRRLRGVKAIPAETWARVRPAAPFDATQSAGLFVGVRNLDDDAFAEVPYAADDAVDLAHLFSLELHLIAPSKVVLALSGEPQKWVSKKRLINLVAQGALRKPPTRSEVIRQLQQLKTSSGAGGLVLVTLATHGFLDEGAGEDFLLASDSVSGRVKTTGIPVGVLFAEVSNAQAPRRMVFLDACRERLFGARGGATQPRELSEALEKEISKTRGLAVLSGTTAGGFSYDDREDKNGVFSKAILEGLGGQATRTKDGFITVETLAKYVNERVQTWVRQKRPDHVDISQGISRQIEGDAERLPLAEAGP